MFNSYFIRFVVLIALALAGCSINKTGKNPAADDLSKLLSINYYSLAEAAFLEGDLENAIALFIRAEQSDPQDLHIKERLLETLHLASYYDEKFLAQVLKLGERFYQEGIYSRKILQIIADCYLSETNYDRADLYYRRALEMEENMRSLTHYYLFRREFFPPADEALLERAAKQAWTDQEDVLLLADLIGETDAEQQLQLLMKADQKWNDEQTLRSLLLAIEKTGDDELLIDLIQQRMDKQEVSVPIFNFLMRIYFRQQKWDKIISNQARIFEIESENLLKFLFFAAVNTDNFELGIKSGLLLEEKGNIADNLLPSFYTYLTKLYFDSEDLTKAAELFAKIKDIRIMQEFMFTYPFEQDSALFEKLTAVFKIFEEITGDTNNAVFMQTIMHTAADNKEEALFGLAKLENAFLIENKLNFSAASLLLQNSGDIEQAIKYIELAPDSVYTANEIISSILFASDRDSLAFAVCLREFAENPEPHITTFLRYSFLAERYDNYVDMKKRLMKAIEIYPENADLKNALGYFIAKNELRDDYDLAAQLLERAVELKPESEAIWDSLAWLYFVRGKPEKALQAMQIPLSREIQNSEIAYHLAAIYLELGELTEARKYLELTIKINDDENSVNKAEELLNDFFLGDKE